MEWKCFSYCDKKAALIEKEPVCLKIPPAASEVVSAELFKVAHRCVGTHFTDGIQNFESFKNI